MNYATCKKVAPWLGLMTASIAVITIVFVKWKFVFESGNVAGKLILISIVAATLTLVFAVITLPRWQGWIGLLVVSYVAYCILLAPPPLYVVPLS